MTMHAEARKIHLIEQVLKITSEATLMELEAVLKRTRKKSAKERKSSIYDFVGVLTPKEADEMKKAIEETCETVQSR